MNKPNGDPVRSEFGRRVPLGTRTSSLLASRGESLGQVALMMAVGLVPMLVEMTVWGARNNKRASVDPEFIRRFETDRAGLIGDIGQQIRRDAGLD